MRKKYAYLTFDDAPTKDFRKRIDFLAEQNIKSLIFCLGKQLEKYRHHAVYAIQHGHILGNHSYDHPNFSSIDLDEARDQIARTDMLLEEIYARAGMSRPMKLFRFPFLNNGSEDAYGTCRWERPHVSGIQQILQELGYQQPAFEHIRYVWFSRAGLDVCRNVDCTYDSFDWCLADGQEEFGYHDLPTVLARMDEDVPEGGRGLNSPESNEIVLMHAWIPYEAMTAIIHKLRAKSIECILPSA